MEFEVTPIEACLHAEVGAHLRLVYEHHWAYVIYLELRIGNHLFCMGKGAGLL